MLKAVSKTDLPNLFDRIAAKYSLQVPMRLADGTRLLRPWQSGELSLDGAPLQQKPTSFFFPQTELLLTISAAGKIGMPTPEEKPLALFGLSRPDLAGIAFLDRFFSTQPADEHYLRRRCNALLIGLAGEVGPDGRWQSPAGKNCDFELIAIGNGFQAQAFSAAGEDWLSPYPAANPSALTEIQRNVETEEKRQTARLQQAARLLEQDLVPDRFWEEIASRCILCSGCNLVCPTCNCFGVQDRRRGKDVERSRVWDSCQFDAFMREASGHNPLGTEALRTRRRIHHKLVADPQRWGELGCVACGRCDRTCPTGIGIFALVEEMLNRYGGSLSAD